MQPRVSLLVQASRLLQWGGNEQQQSRSSATLKVICCDFVCCTHKDRGCEGEEECNWRRIASSHPQMDDSRDVTHLLSLFCVANCCDSCWC